MRRVREYKVEWIEPYDVFWSEAVILGFSEDEVIAFVEKNFSEDVKITVGYLGFAQFPMVR